MADRGPFVDVISGVDTFSDRATLDAYTDGCCMLHIIYACCLLKGRHLCPHLQKALCRNRPRV